MNLQGVGLWAKDPEPFFLSDPDPDDLKTLDPQHYTLNYSDFTSLQTLKLKNDSVQ